MLKRVFQKSGFVMFKVSEVYLNLELVSFAIYVFLHKIYFMLKVGVLGAGHLGKIHLRLLNESEKYDLIGFYDSDAINGKKVADEFGLTYFENLRQESNEKRMSCFH